MPMLPLDHPEPLAATLGVMLFPGLEEQAMARAFSARWVASVLGAYPETRNRLSAELLERLLIDSGRPMEDINRRRWEGLAAGELLKAIYALARTAPDLASLENAIRLYEISVGRSPGCRTNLLAAKKHFEGTGADLPTRSARHC
jgi:hypothetical protein